jgi:Transglutaminase-like superfamily
MQKQRTFLLLGTALMLAQGAMSQDIQTNNIRFTNTQNPEYRFVFPNPDQDTMLLRLKKQFPVEELVKKAKSEQEKVLLSLNWVRNRWEHNGWNDALTANPCTILERADKGEKFRCVEYGIVLKHLLISLGLPARTLGLKTSDVETRKSSAGHVLTEVWLKDHKKWALVDAQFDAMPILDGVPLNAVELQQAIFEKKAFKLININGDFSKKETRRYLDFVSEYLYYFDTTFDQRYMKYADKYSVNGKGGLMLVPVGAKNPTVFQVKYPINSVNYTNSIADFYPVLE